MSIYKIYCKDKNIKDIYVGACEHFDKREYNHKNRCNNKNYKNYNKTLLYLFIRDNGNWDNWIMEELEKVEIEDLCKKEREWYDKLKPSLNTVKPLRDSKEYYKDERERILEYKKKFYQDNIEKIKKRRKEFRNKNKDKINEKARSRVECDICGRSYTYSNKYSHVRSPYHIEHMN